MIKGLLKEYESKQRCKHAYRQACLKNEVRDRNIQRIQQEPNSRKYDFQSENIQELWAEYKANPSNTDLRNLLVEIYRPLVSYNAKQIWSRLPAGNELDDLVSAGIFGLIDAINAFDLSRGIKFERYCIQRIRGAMLDELREMDFVPRLVRSKANRLNNAKKQLEYRLARQPTPEELASEMGLSIGRLEKMQSEANSVNFVSLQKKWYETDSQKDVREIDILKDKKATDPEKRFAKHEALRAVTKGLSRNERMMIISYYYEGMTMKEIGEMLELSESRVSQMHSAIVARLQYKPELKEILSRAA